MQKPLDLEITNTSEQVSKKISNIKTTCKSFMRFFKELTLIEKNYSD